MCDMARGRRTVGSLDVLNGLASIELQEKIQVHQLTAILFFCCSVMFILIILILKSVTF